MNARLLKILCLGVAQEFDALILDMKN